MLRGFVFKNKLGLYLSLRLGCVGALKKRRRIRMFDGGGTIFCVFFGSGVERLRILAFLARRLPAFLDSWLPGFFSL